MKHLKLDAETRVTATIYAGQVIVFALGIWHYGI